MCVCVYNVYIPFHPVNYHNTKLLIIITLHIHKGLSIVIVVHRISNYEWYKTVKSDKETDTSLFIPAPHDPQARQIVIFINHGPWLSATPSNAMCCFNVLRMLELNIGTDCLFRA